MIWIINILVILFLIFRILAIRITRIEIKTKEYHEGNILMRFFIKYPKIIILYNLFFALIIIFCNYYIVIFYPNFIILIQFLFYGALILFLIGFFDFLYDFIVMFKLNIGERW